MDLRGSTSKRREGKDGLEGREGKGREGRKGGKERKGEGEGGGRKERGRLRHDFWGDGRPCLQECFLYFFVIFLLCCF